MPMFRIDLLLRENDSGSSEIYYHIDDNRAGAVETADALALLRMAMTAEICTLQGYRVTPLATSGLPSGRQITVNKTPANITGVAGTKRGEEDVALLVLSTGDGGESARRTHLRFLPYEWQTYNAAGIWTPPAPDFSAAFTNYANFLAAGSFNLRYFNGNLGTNPSSAIVNLVLFDEGGALALTINDEIDGLAAGDRVKVTGYHGAAGKSLNGFYRVIGVTGLNLYLDKVSCLIRNETMPGAGAKVFKEAYLFSTIEDVVQEGLSSRDTGRSFFLRRGRRSKRGPCRFTPAAESLTL